MKPMFRRRSLLLSTSMLFAVGALTLGSGAAPADAATTHRCQATALRIQNVSAVSTSSSTCGTVRQVTGEGILPLSGESLSVNGSLRSVTRARYGLIAAQTIAEHLRVTLPETGVVEVDRVAVTQIKTCFEETVRTWNRVEVQGIRVNGVVMAVPGQGGRVISKLGSVEAISEVEESERLRGLVLLAPEAVITVGDVMTSSEPCSWLGGITVPASGLKQSSLRLCPEPSQPDVASESCRMPLTGARVGPLHGSGSGAVVMTQHQAREKVAAGRREPSPCLDGPGDALVYVGSPGSDSITGTPGPDRIVAFGGGDAVRALDGDDCVDVRNPDGSAATAARNRVLAGAGNDLIFTDRSDRVNAGSGRNRVSTRLGR